MSASIWINIWYLLFGFSFLGTLQPDHKWDGEIELLGRLDDTLGDIIASHNA